MFFFKCRSAIDMRIIDWSSYVCTSDLPAGEVAIGIEQQLDALAKFVLTQEQRVSQRFQIGHNLDIAQRDSSQQARSGYNGFSASRKIMSAVLTYLPHNVTKIGTASCRERVCQYV